MPRSPRTAAIDSLPAGPRGALRSGLHAVLDVAFPTRCVACTRPTVDLPAGERGFCADCLADLPLLGDAVCPRCAHPVVTDGNRAAGDSPQADCPICRDERWAFDGVIALGEYTGLLRHLVLLSKKRSGAAGATEIGRLLATRHAARIDSLEPAGVVGVPTHWKRRLARRVDGVGHLAESLARESGLPQRAWLRRVRATPRQTSVAPSSRRDNVRGAFRARCGAALAGRTVLLVDDVMTTGATCHAAARELKNAGVGRVVAVVAARRVGRL